MRPLWPLKPHVSLFSFKYHIEMVLQGAAIELTLSQIHTYLSYRGVNSDAAPCISPKLFKITFYHYFTHSHCVFTIKIIANISCDNLPRRPCSNSCFFGVYLGIEKCLFSYDTTISCNLETDIRISKAF